MTAAVPPADVWYVRRTRFGLPVVRAPRRVRWDGTGTTKRESC